MSEIITLAKNALLEPAGLGNQDIETLMGKLCSMNIDYADMYFQYSCYESWSLEEGRVKSGSYNQARGVGVRAISGEKTGFAYSDAILLPSLSNAVDAARSIAKQGMDKSIALTWPEKPELTLYSSANPVQSLGDTDKVQLLEQVDKKVRKLDSRVQQVTASLSGVHEVVLIARSDGDLVADIRPLVRLNVNVIVEQNGRREQGGAGGGGRFGYQYFLEHGRIDSYAKEA
ncbi:MAG TPA: metalloprotease TldD, partial [Acidiferrobacteraceae bacterium]|nr:metalloprotease TldD [Acidiferrobacteraceae bacterium]HEX19365.1 metalloprotease TldD [Acidiferrobacteraceae bacterium]